MIQRKRISYSFVLTMAMKAASAMVLLFPVMLSLTRVEACRRGRKTQRYSDQLRRCVFGALNEWKLYVNIPPAHL